MSRSWSVVDFILVILGGFLGAGLFLGVTLALGDSEFLLVLGLAGQYIGHLVVLWLLSKGRDPNSLGFSIKGTDALFLGLGLLLQLMLAVLFLPLTTWLFPEGDSAQQIGDAIAALDTTAARVGAVVVAVVLAPITEELAFRGVLLQTMRKRSNWLAMIVTALVFAAFHMLGLDPGSWVAAAAVVLPQLFIVGVVLAWLTLRTGRLGPAIFVHSGFNLLAAVALLLPAELLEQIS